jgi:uncharacterized membrane protein
MVTLLYAFLLGCICGLRSMTVPAVVAWGAHLGWLHLEGSRSMVPDMLLALVEDLVAVRCGFLLVSHLRKPGSPRA